LLRRIRLFRWVTLIVLSCALIPPPALADGPALVPLAPLTPLTPLAPLVAPMRIGMVAVVTPPNEAVCLGQSFQVKVTTWASAKNPAPNTASVVLVPGATVNFLNRGITEKHPVMDDGTSTPFNRRGTKAGTETVVITVTPPPDSGNSYDAPAPQTVNIRVKACPARMTVKGFILDTGATKTGGGEAVWEAFALEGTVTSDDNGQITGSLHGTWHQWWDQPTNGTLIAWTPEWKADFDVAVQGTAGDDGVDLAVSEANIIPPTTTWTVTAHGESHTEKPVTYSYNVYAIGLMGINSLNFDGEGGTVVKDYPTVHGLDPSTDIGSTIVTYMPEEATS
jgi:hypothetical protein